MTPSDSAQPVPAALAADVKAEAVRGFVAGRATYGTFALEEATFVRRVAAQAERHWSRLQLPSTPERIAAFVHGAALSDLYLASACEAGDERAWQAFAHEFRPRLEGFAVRRGLPGAEAEAITQDLLGDLAAPPPRAPDKRLLGTYDGAGSLFGWLSVVLLRRIAGRARARRPASLDAQEEQVREEARPPRPRSAPEEASDVLADAEHARRFTAALAATWPSLSGQERFALVLKHRDGLTQRQVGERLGLGEARVSRIVAAAVAKLATGLKLALASGGPGGKTDGAGAGGRDLWATLAEALRLHLASLGPVERPSSGRSAGPSGGVGPQSGSGGAGSSQEGA